MIPPNPPPPPPRPAPTMERIEELPPPAPTSEWSVMGGSAPEDDDDGLGLARSIFWSIMAYAIAILVGIFIGAFIGGRLL